MVPSQKNTVLHYGSPPLTYGSPSFYKAITRDYDSKHAQPLMYYRIFDAEFFSWTKQLQHKTDIKIVYLIVSLVLLFLSSKGLLQRTS